MNAYLPLMWSILRRRYSLSHEEAEETISDAWTVVIRRVAAMPGRERRVAWLASIVCWTARGVIRRRRDVASSTELLEQLPQPGENAPDEIVETMETGRLVREAVQGLSDRDRTLIEGKHFTYPPLSHAALAAKIGVSENSIGSLLGRALKRLRKALSDRGLEPPQAA